MNGRSREGNRGKATSFKGKESVAIPLNKNQRSQYQQLAQNPKARRIAKL
jgi:hypothetical protein